MSILRFSIKNHKSTIIIITFYVITFRHGNINSYFFSNFTKISANNSIIITRISACVCKMC